MKLFIFTIVFLITSALMAQTGYKVTYEVRSVNNTYTKLSEQFTGEDRAKMASVDHLTRTFQLLHVNGVSLYSYVSTQYDSMYTGEQYYAGTSTVHYKDMRSVNDLEMLEVSKMRGCARKTTFRSELYDLTDSTKIIGNLLTQKAVNRDFPDSYVWFAPRIPISDGPKQEAGFPGLVIQKVNSSHRIVMVAIEEIDGDLVPSIVRPECAAGRGNQ
ncbi:GLPGLI family protein [Neolewinella antarctica]|uniref:GLPGLI family protein n=1 Tax=Neolewinella antarctica TaxID=442734 RepID=A0ABX0XCM3_9BACT|nr:GLPGLI family protein [Neolewinella antarctica]NJC26537.1 GLPGLI family protein [Neolewinella antarctica]